MADKKKDLPSLWERSEYDIISETETETETESESESESETETETEPIEVTVKVVDENNHPVV